MKRLITTLQQYGGQYPQEIKTVERFRALVEKGSDVLSRHHYVPGHITSSCWLVNPSLDAVLLTQHRKLNRWLQLGGHVDGESDVLASSVREVQEESGINEIEVLLESPIDIDIHEIPARKNEPAHCHYDLRFLLMTRHENIQISEESTDLRWLPFSEVSDFIDELSMLRLHAKSQAWLSEHRSN